jgi:acyl-CoA thioesterase FadM
MTNWIETYRVTVPPWECDVTEHFTIAYYLTRLEEAEPGRRAGLGVRLRAGGFVRRLDVRFARELRAGSSFQVDGAVLGLDDGLRLAHRFVDSANGETVTWIDERRDLAQAPLSAEERRTLGGRLAVWEGPAAEARPEPKGTAGFVPTARGRVRPADLDARGHFGLAAMVHRFTDDRRSAWMQN